MFERIHLPTDPNLLFVDSCDGSVMVRCTYTNSTDLVREHVSFDVKDDRGRTIGAKIATYRRDRLPLAGSSSLCQPAALGRGWYVADWHATRDGKLYGASNSTSYFETEEARAAAIAKYLSGARKRAAKAAR